MRCRDMAGLAIIVRSNMSNIVVFDTFIELVVISRTNRSRLGNHTNAVMVFNGSTSGFHPLGTGSNPVGRSSDD